MVFLFEYLAIIAKLFLGIGVFLYEATRRGGGFILCVVIIAYGCASFLIRRPCLVRTISFKTPKFGGETFAKMFHYTSASNHGQRQLRVSIV